MISISPIWAGEQVNMYIQIWGRVQQMKSQNVPVFTLIFLIHYMKYWTRTRTNLDKCSIVQLND